MAIIKDVDVSVVIDACEAGIKYIESKRQEKREKFIIEVMKEKSGLFGLYGKYNTRIEAEEIVDDLPKGDTWNVYESWRFWFWRDESKFKKLKSSAEVVCSINKYTMDLTDEEMILIGEFIGG